MTNTLNENMKLRKYLNGFADVQTALGDIEKEYGICPKQHKQFPNLYQFTYDQIDSAHVKDHPIVRESRGVILDSTDNWNVVSRSFDRFFNYGEVGSFGAAIDPDFDWDSIRVFEKIDGSLMTAYWYGRQWNVCTKGSPDAGGEVDGNGFTFAELFWKAFDNCLNYVNPDEIFVRGFNYIFELTSEYNRVVTSQMNNPGTITLIGLRDYFGQEIKLGRDYESIFPLVESFPFSTVEEIVAASLNLDPNQQEGFVIVDKNFKRLKIKSPKYVMIHHLKDTLNDEKMIGLIKLGETSELFVYFPDLQVRFVDLLKRYDELMITLDVCYDEGAATKIFFASQKDFALYVQQSIAPKFHNFFFQKRAGRVKDAKEWFANMHDKKLLELLTSN